ncbi:MAG: endopeptidase La [Bradymonadia bacterium]
MEIKAHLPHGDTAFPVLPLRSGALLPGRVITVTAGRKRSAALVRALLEQRRRDPDEATPSIIGVAVQRDPHINAPGLADLHPVGTYAHVLKILQVSEGVFQVTLVGIKRFALNQLERVEPYWRAFGEPLESPSAGSSEVRLKAEALRSELEALRFDEDHAMSQVIENNQGELDPDTFSDAVAAALDLTQSQAVALLLTLDVNDRLDRVSRLAGEILASSDVKSRIEKSVRTAFNRQQREAILRQQLKAIKKELGEGGDEDGSEVDRLRARIEEADPPAEVMKAVERELKRLDSTQGAEANVIRTWLELVADLPWNARAELNGDLNGVGQRLDADHTGLDDVKKRILEHMAVLKLSGNPRGTILCLAGPPGVGKTSLARSVAEATGRPFVRIALGGVRDEAEIRGHRRTYVGALPGRILNGLRKAEARNPIVLLDEIDKMGVSFGGGSPESALLEVLDPEQNGVFTDHYLEQPFDLGEVLFICTANDLGRLSAPLRDRLEIVEISGYTQQEKVQIARKHLLPRQLDAHGVGPEADLGPALEITDEALAAIVDGYTREAGVRQLERELIRICRAAALTVARSEVGPETPRPVITLGADDLAAHLGKPKFTAEVAERTAIPGVATGLAWTPVGGDILFIETSKMPGKGGMQITGQLGDVMKESARAALTYVRSHADALGIPAGALDDFDLHVHVPAGAVPKDGPSAGVTIFTALTSLLTDRTVRADTAMTGEVTLRGRVLPVGGIKSKVLAAHRAGISRVILPVRNGRDLDDVPESVRDQMEFILAEDMSQVLEAALGKDTALPSLPEVPGIDGAAEGEIIAAGR